MFAPSQCANYVARQQAVTRFEIFSDVILVTPLNYEAVTNIREAEPALTYHQVTDWSRCALTCLITFDVIEP